MHLVSDGMSHHYALCSPLLTHMWLAAASFPSAAVPKWTFTVPKMQFRGQNVQTQCMAA